MAAIGNLCLRLPDNSAAVYNKGALPLMAKAMRRHPGAAGMQRSACLVSGGACPVAPFATGRHCASGA
jgi:hypothetical protein